MSVIDAIEIGNAEGDQLEVTLRGEAAAIVKVLCQGLPREALLQVKEATEAEIAKRHDAKAD